MIQDLLNDGIEGSTFALYEKKDNDFTANKGTTSCELNKNGYILMRPCSVMSMLKRRQSKSEYVEGEHYYKSG